MFNNYYKCKHKILNAYFQTGCVSEVSLRTLRVVQSTVSNSSARRPYCKFAAIEYTAASVTAFGSFIYYLQQKDRLKDEIRRRIL